VWILLSNKNFYFQKPLIRNIVSSSKKKIVWHCRAPSTIPLKCHVLFEWPIDITVITLLQFDASKTWPFWIKMCVNIDNNFYAISDDSTHADWTFFLIKFEYCTVDLIINNFHFLFQIACIKKLHPVTEDCFGNFDVFDAANIHFN